MRFAFELRRRDNVTTRAREGAVLGHVVYCVEVSLGCGCGQLFACVRQECLEIRIRYDFAICFSSEYRGSSGPMHAFKRIQFDIRSAKMVTLRLQRTRPPQIRACRTPIICAWTNC